MSIGELALLVNDNFDKPLNQQIREMQYIGSYVFTSSTTFTPDKSGYYKVIVVGAGGAHDRVGSAGNYCYASGGAGGVAIKNMHLLSTREYTIDIESGNSTFNGNLVATAGGDGKAFSTSSATGGAGGTASGGDFNYDGLQGTTSVNNPPNGGSVGVFIPGLMLPYSTETGLGILGYGIGGTSGAAAGGAAIIIIPLELEE